MCEAMRTELTMCISILCKKYKWAEQAAHSARAIITFNHWTLSPSFAGFLATPVLIYPPSSRGKEKSHSLDRLLSRPLRPAPINHSLIRGLWDWAQLPLGSTAVTPRLLPTHLGVLISLCFTRQPLLYLCWPSTNWPALLTVPPGHKDNWNVE